MKTLFRPIWTGHVDPQDSLWQEWNKCGTLHEVFTSTLITAVLPGWKWYQWSIKPFTHFSELNSPIKKNKIRPHLTYDVDETTIRQSAGAHHNLLMNGAQIATFILTQSLRNHMSMLHQKGHRQHRALFFLARFPKTVHSKWNRAASLATTTWRPKTKNWGLISIQVLRMCCETTLKMEIYKFATQCVGLCIS